MNALLTYRGRTVTDEDVAFLRQLIADQQNGGFDLSERHGASLA